MDELVQMFSFFLLVLVVSMVPVAAVLGPITWAVFGAGRRRDGFAGLVGFLLAATISAYVVTVLPDPARLIYLPALALLPAGPLFYGMALLYAGLWVALGLMTFALAAAILALRRWPGRTGSSLPR